MDMEGFANELIVRIEGQTLEDGTFQKGNFDNFILVGSGGEKGKGKTVFTCQLSKIICKKKGIPYHRTATKEKPYTFDLIVFSATTEDIVEWVKKLPDFTPIHIDEITKVGYKRDFQKAHVKKLIKFIKICRKFKKIVIGNDPDFWDIDKDLRNLADFRVICLKRGMVQVRGKSKNPDRVDKWCRDECAEKISKFAGKNEMSISKIMEGIRQSAGFQYDIRVPDMDEDEYNAYEQLSKEMELKSFEEESQSILEQRLWIMAVNLLTFHETTQDCALALNRLYQESVWHKDGAKPPFTDSWLRNIRNRGKSVGVVA